jgi:hypothetical protein
MMFWMGIYPQSFLRKMDSSVNHLLDSINTRKIAFTEARKEKNLLPETAREKAKENYKETQEISR